MFKLLLPKSGQDVSPIVFIVLPLEGVYLLNESSNLALLLLSHLVHLVEILPEYCVLEI